MLPDAQGRKLRKRASVTQGNQPIPLHTPTKPDGGGDGTGRVRTKSSPPAVSSTVRFVEPPLERKGTKARLAEKEKKKNEKEKGGAPKRVLSKRRNDL